MYTINMVIDALAGFDMEQEIKAADAPILGIRLVDDSQEDCLVVSRTGEDGADVVCRHAGNEIRLPGSDVLEVMNCLLASFDEHMRWEQFLVSLITKDSPQAIINSVGAALQRPVMIVDSHNMMCTMTSVDFGVRLPEWKYARAHGHLPSSTLENMGRSMVFRQRHLSSQGRPFAAQITNTGGEAIVCELGGRSSAANAFLIAFGDEGAKITPGMLDVFYTAVEAVGRWATVHEGIQTLFLKADLLTRLAAGDDVSDAEIEAQKRELPSSDGNYVLMRVVYPSEDDHVRTVAAIQESIPCSRCFDAGDDLCALVADRPQLEKELVPIAEDNDLRFGLSWRFSDWRDIPRAVNQTEVALSNYAGRVAVLDSHCMMFYIFSILLSSTTNIEILHPAILALAEYDERHNSEYLRTLWCYLRHERNLVRTSEDLGIHRNSLVYRVKKIEKIIPEVDLDDSETRIHLMVSYRIYGLKDRVGADIDFVQR